MIIITFSQVNSAGDDGLNPGWLNQINHVTIVLRDLAPLLLGWQEVNCLPLSPSGHWTSQGGMIDFTV